MSLLAVERLTIAYGARRALDDVSFTIAAGEIVGIVGASGSGKSTLAFAAIDLLPEDAEIVGTICFAGQPLDARSERQRNALRGAGIGLIFQDPAAALDPLMTIGAQVSEAIRAHATIGRRAAWVQAGVTLARCGLAAADVSPSRYPHQLSGGQRQRVGIAIAIAANPRLLIADEPATALDPITQAHILTLLRTLVREEGMALMLISHDLALVAGVADRIAVMDGGKVVELAPTARLLAAPATDYARQLIAASAPEFARKSVQRVPLLEAKGLCFAYSGSKLVVADASFSIGRGEIVGLIGASGSGKSSLLRLILSLTEPQSGEVRLNGQDFARMKGSALRPLRRQVQGVFQHPHASFDPRWRVRDIVAEPLGLLDPGTPSESLVARAIERVGLAAHLLDRRSAQLSGGERQRVAIARAIVLEPALVVLDEATSALDPISRAAIFRLIARLSEEQGIAFLIATHDLTMIRGFADRLMVMEAGRIVEQGETKTLLAHPTHPHSRALIAATPNLGTLVPAPRAP